MDECQVHGIQVSVSTVELFESEIFEAHLRATAFVFS
jgi:hypothetical protein